jgi:serine/threonine-protein kinase
MAPPRTDGLELLGKTLGHFTVLAKIGQGGMGVVYRAVDETLRRDVALKVLPDEVTADPERRARFVREARAAAAVSHPSIATIYEVGEADGRVWLAMELVEGEPLRARIERSPLPFGAAIDVARGVAGALAKAHDKGIVHRDIKPENVMLGEDGRPKVLDFGLAKLFDPAAPSSTAETAPAGSLVTEEGRVMGTPGYMSPEQARGAPVDARTDVFAFGVMLFELVTGRRPFVGANAVDVIVAVARDEAPAPSSIVAGVPAAIDAIVARCLAKDPSGRYANGGEIAAALAGVTADAGAAQASTPAASSAPVSTGAATAATVTATPRPARGARAIALVLGLAAIVAAGAVALRRAGAPPSGATQTASPSASAAPKPAALADLPDPPSKVPEAVAAYREGMRAVHVGAPSLALLERAIALDPTMGAAHVAIVLTYTLPPDEVTPSVAREHFRRARELEASLSERDRILLEAREPLVLRQPADTAEAARRQEVGIARLPGDAYAHYVAGNDIAGHDFARAVEVLTRATTLDPTFSPALATQGQLTAYLGRFEEARASLARCVRAAPGSSACAQNAVWVAEHEGRCDDAEAVARLLLAASPGNDIGPALLASTLAGRAGTPALLEALRPKWARLPDAARRAEELRDRVRLDLLAGDFEAALSDVRSLEHEIEPSPREADHGLVARWHVQAEEEAGRPAEAGRVARAYIDRHDAWEPEPRAEDWALAGDALPAMLAAARASRTLDRAEVARRRDAWLAAWRKKGMALVTSYLWFHGYGATVVDADDARDALDALPTYQPLAPFRPMTLVEATTGRTFLLADRVDEALPWLEAATKTCRALELPVLHTRAHLWLGQAREKKGDRAGACAAYGVVLDRWGKAKPRSVTADEARARAKALGCK